jgi:hypothetical protein
MYLGKVHTSAGHVREAQDAWRRAISIVENTTSADAGQLRAKLAELVDRHATPGGGLAVR